MGRFWGFSLLTNKWTSLKHQLKTFSRPLKIKIFRTETELLKHVPFLLILFFGDIDSKAKLIARRFIYAIIFPTTSKLKILYRHNFQIANSILLFLFIQESQDLSLDLTNETKLEDPWFLSKDYSFSWRFEKWLTQSS